MNRNPQFGTAFIGTLVCLLTLAAASVSIGQQDAFKGHIAQGEAQYKASKYDDAIREFKAAVRLRPNESMAHLWLGRALGRKAEKANPLRAAFMVGDIREAFERAVQLDPRNLEARSDLLDFYLEAPGAFGGGVDKARKQADAMMQIDKAEGHSALARIAVKEKRWKAAEQEYRLAVSAQPGRDGYKRDLEAFLRKYGAQLKNAEL